MGDAVGAAVPLLVPSPARTLRTLLGVPPSLVPPLGLGCVALPRLDAAMQGRPSLGMVDAHTRYFK